MDVYADGKLPMHDNLSDTSVAVVPPRHLWAKANQTTEQKSQSPRIGLAAHSESEISVLRPVMNPVVFLADRLNALKCRLLLRRIVQVDILTDHPGLSMVDISTPNPCSQSPLHWREYHFSRVDKLIVPSRLVVCVEA